MAAWRVIGCLGCGGDETQAKLAAKLDISRVALGEALDRLERDGWIERRADEADRRTWRIHLTPTARKDFLKLQATANKARKKAFSVLSKTEFETLETLLVQLQGHLQALRQRDCRRERDE